MNVRSVYIFPDDTLIEEREHVTHVMGQVRKHSGPVIQPDMPSDLGGVTFPNVIFDEEEKIFKAWYSAQPRAIERHVSDPLESSLSPTLTGYATSSDGIQWEKPRLGIVEVDGLRDNNICDSVHVESLVKDNHESDVSRRYKRLMYDSSKRSLHILFSADGIHWTWPTKDKPLFESWDVIHDTHFLMGWDEKLGKYVAFLRPPVSLDPHRLRKIGVSMTSDCLDWPAPDIVLEADELDPDGHDNKGDPRGMDLYQMAAFSYGQGYLGFLNNFDAQLAKEFNDPIYVTLASSLDCRQWNRPLRSRFFSTGNPGEFDSGMVYASSKPVIFDDEILIYYCGYPHAHTGWCPAHAAVDPEASAAVGLAKLRLDGFVGLYTNPYPGRLVTVPLTVDGTRMLVNCIPDKRNDGWLRVEIQDESMKPLDGFTRDECRPITSEGLYNEISWTSGRLISGLRGRKIRVCLYQWENVFYAFRFVDD